MNKKIVLISCFVMSLNLLNAQETTVSKETAGSNKNELPVGGSEKKSPSHVSVDDVRIEFLSEHGVLNRLMQRDDAGFLNKENPNMNDGLIVLVGDVYGNGKPVGIVQYSITRKGDDVQAVPVIEGIYLYPTKQGKLNPIELTGVDLPSSPAYLHSVKDGVLYFKKISYAEGDPLCCPSKEAIVGYKLTDLLEWKKVSK